MTGDELAVWQRLEAVLRYRDACEAWWLGDMDAGPALECCRLARRLGCGEADIDAASVEGARRAEAARGLT